MTRLFGVLLGTFLAAAPVVAKDASATRLELLAQQIRRAYVIAKSTCLVMSGTQAQQHSEVAFMESFEFQDIMTGLIEGDSARGLTPEENADLRGDLEEIQAYALGLTKSASQVVSGDFHTVPVGLILTRNQGVARQLKDTLLAATQRYSPPDQSDEIRNAIYQLELQRALVEELLRDICYARLNIGPPTLGAQMSEKISQFENINASLVKGNAALGVGKAPNASIKIALGQAASKWISLRALLETAVRGETQDVRDVELASVIGNTMSAKLTKLIVAYGKI